MLKIKENKTRKRLRIAQCVFYLAEILLCSFTYVHIPNPSEGRDFYATVFDMLGYIGSSVPDMPSSAAFKTYIPFFLIFLIIPIIGFFFCALDKERNLKNIVSIFCCLAGVLSILMIVSINFLDFGSVFALMIYILISFLTTIAMMARIADNPSNNSENK